MSRPLRPRLVNGRYGDPALYVECAHEPGALLFDLGDLALLSSRELLRVTHVFLSHMHMDHFIGFDSLLRVHVGRHKLITVVGPEGVIDCVASKLAGYSWDLVGRYSASLSFDVLEMVDDHRARRAHFEFRSAFAKESLAGVTLHDGLVVGTPAFQVSAAVLEHHGPCLGFTLSEPVRINVWRNRVKERGLPLGAWLKTLKAAVRDHLDDDATIALPNGEDAPLGTLRELVSMTPGQRIGYVTDIRDSPANMAAVARLCAGTDPLFIEASFAASEEERAQERGHLTTMGAGRMAKAAGARRVEPFHFSPRNRLSEYEMLAEVDMEFRGQTDPGTS
jgi:ribonuclease Z